MDNTSGTQGTGNYLPDSGTFDYSSHDKEQINRATVGEGTIIVRSDPDKDLSGLNRDPNKAQEITKDDQTNMHVYVNPDVIKDIANGGEGLINAYGDLYGQVEQEIRKHLPEIIEEQKQEALSVAEKMSAAGVSDQLVEKLREENKLELILLNRFDSLVAEYGGQDNVPEGEWQKLIIQFAVFSSANSIVAAENNGLADYLNSKSSQYLNLIIGLAAGVYDTAAEAALFTKNIIGMHINGLTGGKYCQAEDDAMRQFFQSTNDAVVELAKNSDKITDLVQKQFIAALEKDRQAYNALPANEKLASSGEMAGYQAAGILMIYAMDAMNGGNLFSTAGKDAQALIKAAGGIEKVVEKYGPVVEAGIVRTGQSGSVTFSLKQLDKKFKHASDFGLENLNKNTSSLTQFQNAIKAHLDSPVNIPMLVQS